MGDFFREVLGVIFFFLASGMLLEFNWGSRDQGHLEEKRQSLLKRSARRVEQVKAKGALARSGAAAEGSVQSGERPLQTKVFIFH